MVRALVAALLLWLSGIAAAQDESAEDLAFLAELRADFRRGGSHGALRDLEEYLQDFPRSVEARRLAAEAALRRGRLAEAEEHLRAGGDPDARLAAAILLRRGRFEEALQLARSGRLAALASARLAFEALDGAGQRRQALREADAVTRDPDTRGLDGHELAALGWLLAAQRRFELAAQALVFADQELNGRKGPNYRLEHPEVLVQLGGVYLAARQSGQEGPDRTLSTLNEVLEVDGSHPDALVGKARTYVYGHNGGLAREALDRALSRDPEHPEALVLRGELRLLARQSAAAVADAERVLAANPRQRGALALRAAALATTRRSDEAEAARALFAERHPESAALDLLLGRTLQDHYRFEESLAPLERALAHEPEDESPLPILAQSLAHLGREIEARAALEEHLRRSPYAYPWRQNMLALLAKLDGFVERRTPAGFLLRLPPGEQDVLGVLLEQRLEQARVALGERWGVLPEETVLVEVFDVHRDFSVRTVGFEGFGALGACFGHVVTMLSPLSEVRGGYHWERTAVHEYAHVVTLTLSRQRLPRWLSEGVSVFEEKAWDPRWARPLERAVLDARANDLLFGVERLDEAFQDVETIALGYYLGSLVCEVVVADFGFPALRELVASFADGRSTEEAVRDILHVPPAELDARVAAFIDREIASRSVLRPTYGERGKEALRKRVLAGDEGALVPLAAAYHDLGARVDRDTILQRASESLGETPALLRLLAERDHEAGRSEAARERLLRWASGSEVDADGLLLLGRLQLASGDRAAAIETLQRARGLSPRDVSPHGALAQLLRLLDRKAEPDAWREVLVEFCTWDEASLPPRLELVADAQERGDVEEALRWLRDVVAIEPYDFTLRLDLAELLAERDEFLGAREQWTLVLGMRPEQMRSAGLVQGPIAEMLTEDLSDAQQTARRRLQETAPAVAPEPTH